MTLQRLAVVACLACPMAFGAQVTSGSGRTRTESVPHAFYADIVEGEPFQASFELNERSWHPDGQVTTGVMRGRLLRDGKGRIRQEIYELTSSGRAPATPPGEALLVTIQGIPNPLTNSYVLWPSRKTFQRFSWGIPDGTPVQGPGLGFSGSVLDPNGTGEAAQIEGLRCRKMHIKLDSGETASDWVCDDLQEVIREEIGTRCTWLLTDVVRGEPDPKLFEIPPDYKEVTGRTDFEAPVVPAPR